MCFGVATFLTTCFFMVALVVSLLHDLAWALLHAAMNPYSHLLPGMQKNAMSKLDAAFKAQELIEKRRE